LAVFVSSLLLSSQPVHAAAITVEGDAPLKSITVTIEGATLKNIVGELSQKYGFEVQGLDDMTSTDTLLASLSGSLRSVLESLLRNCNYMLVSSAENKSGIERVVITNCTQTAAPSPGRTNEQSSDTLQQQILDTARLDQLVAPIALYPDTLLAQVLMASTYPFEVVQAGRFAEANKKLKGDKLKEALAKQDWDASVKELVSTPTVLAMMNDRLDWTERLGDGVLAQQADVMDAIQRLRAKAKANGKLETTDQQMVTVTQEAGQQVIEIEPASPDVIYVPYYDPTVVYGEWPYPEYPPYYYTPPTGYVVGGAIATGLAWGVAYAIGREIWDDIDWDHGDINIDLDRNVAIHRDFKKWEHDSYHRRGVQYDNTVKNKFAKVETLPVDRKLDYRGRSGDQVLKHGKAEVKSGGAELPSVSGDRPHLGAKGPVRWPPDSGQQQGLVEQGLAVNAFDPRDGARVKDFAKRGQTSLGSRGVPQVYQPSRAVPTAVRRSGGAGSAHFRGGGRGGGHISRGGGRRSDIRLKQDIVPLTRLNNGLELYRFRYKGSDRTVYVGVMAQEVQRIEPNAVWRDREGFLMVNYDRVEVKFMTWKEWLAQTGAGDHFKQAKASWKDFPSWKAWTGKCKTTKVGAPKAQITRCLSPETVGGTFP
jgi:hypothetical protein